MTGLCAVAFGGAHDVGGEKVVVARDIEMVLPEVAGSDAKEADFIAGAVAQGRSTSVLMSRRDCSVILTHRSQAWVFSTARRGDRAGGEFWGCVNDPRCRETRAVVD